MTMTMTDIMITFRSTSCGRWRGRTRRTPAWRSTSAGRWSDDLDLDGGGSQGSDLLLHTVSNTGVHGGASRHDGVEGGLVDAAGLHSQEAGLEESLRAPEPLVSD